VQDQAGGWELSLKVARFAFPRVDRWSIRVTGCQDK